MNKNLFFIKRLFIFLGLGLVFLLSKSFRKIFARKTILYVSRTGIKSYSVGYVQQIVVAYLLFWVGTLFFQSLAYDSIIKNKSNEINNLEEANSRFKREVHLLSESLVKINEYFTSISDYSNTSSGDDIDDKMKKNTQEKFKEIFGELNLNKDDKKIAGEIADSNAMLDNIKSVARTRINDLEKKIAISGLVLSSNKLPLGDNRYDDDSENSQTTEISLNGSKELRSKQGGPFQGIKSGLIRQGKKLMSFNGVDIRDEISYLSDLEKFIHKAPFSKPMKNYYVSSGFGARTDPIHGGGANHGGMDFVGHSKELVISPSIGKVIFAGKLGAYGNAVIIDHGYGITTRYGHLSSIKVAEGQLVKKGDSLATQGSTGRSTGPHLHYEVRYKNTPLNPKKFLQAGQEIFNDDSSLKNVDI